MGHTIITLLETNDKGMNILNFIFKYVHQTINSRFFLHQIIAKSRSIYDSDDILTHIAQKSSCIMTSFFGHWSLIVSKSINFKATMLKTSAIEIFIPPNKTFPKLDFPTPVAPKITILGLANLSAFFLGIFTGFLWNSLDLCK